MRLVRRILFGVVAVSVLVIAVLGGHASWERYHEATDLSTLKKTLMVTSGSFPPDGDMPMNCTCKGKALSPALVWEGSPSTTKSFVVLTTDYDAPTSVLPLANLTHWLVYNLPASIHSLPEGITLEQMRLLGGKTGKSSTGQLTYLGPCPPIGRHAYVFRIYALDNTLSFSGMPDRGQLLEAMKGHVLNYGELTGYYQ